VATITDPTDTISERRWQEQVLAWADRGGWLAYHTFDSRRSAPGFPDLVLLRRDWLRLPELKANHGHLSARQEVWQTGIAQVRNIEGGVWYPRDYQLVRDILLGGVQ
jgi:hypothetical protein